MTMKRSILAVLMLAGCLAAFQPGPAVAATEIYWWHAMGGALGESVNGLAERFNQSQSDYVVVPVYKGNYTETMTGAIAAFRARKHPHIVQVFEVGTATMMAAEGAVYPVYQLMQDMQEPFDQSRYIAAVAGYYATPEGNMLSLPFNSSTPVLYYNKDAFRKAGLDPEKPPRTWPELAKVSRTLIQAGAVKYGFTVGWQSWVLVENFSAWHNLPIGTLSNGFDGLNTEFSINTPQHAAHLQAIADWQKENIFKYAGRRSEPNPLFIAGECAFLMNSSASTAGIQRGATFDFGISFLPYWPNISGAPQNSIIGGATLWVLKGHKTEEYKGVARFMTFLSRPEIQADFHQSTGYVPITSEAYELSRSQGFYDANAGADIAIKQLNYAAPTKHSRGLRFGNFVQARDIFNEELESLWAGTQDANAALEAMTRRGNGLLRRFEQTHQ